MLRKAMAAVVVAFVVMGSMAIAEDEMCVPMGEITLSSLAEEAKRSEVTFPHAVHFSYTCQQCHHKWDGQAPIVGCTTSGCHDLAELPKPKNGKTKIDATMKARYYKDAFHAMCIGCHKNIAAKNKAAEASGMALSEKLPATGPTGCNQCHPK